MLLQLVKIFQLQSALTDPHVITDGSRYNARAFWSMFDNTYMKPYFGGGTVIVTGLCAAWSGMLLVLVITSDANVSLQYACGVCGVCIHPEYFR